MIRQDHFADLGKRRSHRGDLEEHVYTVTILGKHALNAGNLPSDALQPPIGIQTRSFIHEFNNCTARAAVTGSVTNRACGKSLSYLACFWPSCRA